jgi:DNA invertase Pin-like site-specific DNA recombinase
MYMRASTLKQEHENQVAETARFIEANGWERIELVDYGSGKDAEREKFQELFSLAARRQIDVVVVCALDRFSREGVAETYAHIQKLATYGVGLVSVTEPHFRTTGPAGELMIAVAAWIAKQERIRISERVRAGLERARKNGTKTGQPIGRPRIRPPPGRRLAGTGSQLAANLS